MAFWRLCYHMVWATKNREPFITRELEDRLYAYIVRKAAELRVYVYAINGWSDHIHLIVAIPPKHAVAEVVRRLKGASSHYVNQSIGLGYEFGWQRGYGALSLGIRQRPEAVAYVQGQKEHHSGRTVNPWLERSAEVEEGPVEAGIEADAVSPVLHERREAYDALGEAPF